MTDADLGGYTVRFAPQTSGVSWSSATDLVTQIPRTATSITVPAAVGTFLIKAVDTGDRQSLHEDIVTSTIAALAGYNAVLTVTEDTGFTGAWSGVGNASGVLQLSGADSIDAWANIDTVTNADVGNAGLLTSGTYSFANSVDLGAIYTSRLTADMQADGVDTSLRTDLWVNTDALGDWDQAADPSLWDVTLELRMTNDNPAGTPAWSGWMPFVIGDYSARAFQFRALLSADVAGVTPAVSRLRVNVDMPDRTLGLRSLTALAAGSTVAFSAPFRATPALSITAQNMATGDYYAITGASASGFTINFYNAAGTGISRTFDYLAKGYGQQI